MPLKHTTETFLLFLLGAITVLTGLLIRSLPDLPEALLPWAVLFVITVVYRLIVAPLFRRNRADNFFRNIHWIPALMLLLWAGLQGLGMYNESVAPALYWFTWGWSLPIVTTAFIAMVWFTLKVLRRFQQRLILLAAAFVPALVGGILSETKDWNSQVTAALWSHELWQTGQMSSVSVIVAQETSSSEVSEISSIKNLGASLDPAEEGYRERLRAIERRRERIAKRLEEWEESSSSSVASVAASESEASSQNFLGKMLAAITGGEEGSESSVFAEGQTSSKHQLKTVMGQAMSDPDIKYAQSSSKPSELPGSGFSWLLIILCALGLYTANVHYKTVKRSLA